MLSRFQHELESFLSAIPPRAARTLLTHDIPSALRVLYDLALSSAVLRPIACSFAYASDLEQTMLTAIRVMAELVAAEWSKINKRSLSDRWVERAEQKLERGSAPFFSTIPLEVQAEQLSRALTHEQRELLFILSVRETPEESVHLYSLARAAEWLTEKTGARVVVILPPALRSRAELDPILYGAAEIELQRSPEPLGVLAQGLRGRPHPFSDAEKKLAEAIARDRELSEKLELNQTVETIRGSKYLVDLLWRDGRAIIELDGFATHGDRASFQTDRHRDYELSISNYLVVRITNEEVDEDLAIAVEKIRDVLRARSPGDKK